MVPRNTKIDSMRGLACLLLVLYHAVGSDPGRGLHVSEGWLREINDLLGYVRMPIFTFLSGYVYAWRPLKADYGRFIRNKIRRLILPLVVVGTAYAVVKSLVPGTSGSITEWGRLHLIPVDHYWFLEALFWIFLAIIPLEKLGLCQTRPRCLLTIAASILIHSWAAAPTWLALSGAVHIFPFFLCGLYCSRFNFAASTSARPGGWAALIVGLGAVFTLGERTIGGTTSLPGLVLGVTVCIGLLAVRVDSAWLARIGYYSYSIYLFHIFFTAGARIGLLNLGLSNLPALVMITTGLGLLGPILIERYASTIGWLRTPLLGQRY